MAYKGLPSNRVNGNLIGSSGSLSLGGSLILSAGTRDNPAIQFVNSDVGVYVSGQALTFHGETGATWTFEEAGSKVTHIRNAFNGGVANTEWSGSGVHIGGTVSIGRGFSWGHTASVKDSILGSPSAGIVALYGTNTQAQKLAVYNTYTDGSNYERAVLDWQTTANLLRIGTEAAGTGTQRNMLLSVGAGSIGVGPDATSPSNILDLQRNGDAQEKIKITNTDAVGTASAAGFRASGAVATFRAFSWGTSAASTTFGVSRADLNEIVATAGAAFALGTTNTAPLVFGTNNVERARFLPSKSIFVLPEAVTNPTTSEISSLSGFGIYMKNDKLVIAYNNAATMTYISIPMDGSTTTWTHSTTAP